MITKQDLFTYVPPAFVRLSACSACQLDCPACDPHTRPEKRNGALGWGYLRVKDFSAFIRRHPYIKTIELGHSGEIFLNPELGAIIKDAFEQGVTLVCRTGVNLNKISPQVAEDMVKYRFKFMRVAIDGADDEVYAIYRRRGNYTDVINNIKMINAFKEQYRSPYPQLEWQFIPFGHNEHQILKARQAAKELNMSFLIKLNSKPDYAPVVKYKRLIRKIADLQSATREEYHEKSGIAAYLSCYQLWTAPQINWDGKMMGCCANYFGDTGNVFDEGLEAVMKSQRYVDMKKTVLGLMKPGSDVPCSQCLAYLREVSPESMVRSTLKMVISPPEGAPRING